jgi:hypothetical protein
MVTKFLPLPDNNGGRQRTMAIVRRLAALGDVVLCAYDEGDADRIGLREM